MGWEVREERASEGSQVESDRVGSIIGQQEIRLRQSEWSVDDTWYGGDVASERRKIEDVRFRLQQ